MPTNITSRVINILIVLFVVTISVFGVSASRWFNPNLTFIQKTNLHPGIDMVGGVSLVYQIQAPPGPTDPNLAVGVMDALKRRVDPDGLKNLVWRPEGNTRLEIQMPLSPEAGQAVGIKEKFNSALQALDLTNIRQDQVLSAVEQLTGPARDARLATLAADSPARKALFAALVSAWDQFQSLSQKINQSASPDAATIAAARDAQDKYQSLQSGIEATDLQSVQYQQILEEANSDDPDKAKAGQTKIDDLKKQYADFPSRLKAMDAVSSQFKDYLSVQNAITGSEDLKRLLQGSGVLEFHILADSVTSSPADLQTMDQRLQPNGAGPLPQPGDKIQWMEVDKVEEFDLPGRQAETREWNGKHYVPVLVTPDASMTKASGSWGLNHAYRTSEDGIHAAVGFEFNNVGAGLFGDLTRHWHDLAAQRGGGAEARLAIVLDGKVISAPNIQNAITGGSGVITGGGQAGFTSAELDYLINTLNAGSLPAQLSSQPISEQNVGPTLGADNLNKGLIACGFGLVVVAIFLVSYYYLAGAVAFVAVCFNVLIILGVMAGLGATFTLPSIAGIVLTIGTAVDANVLIFERLREEQHKGLPLRLALRNSYNQAQSAIIDSNMTSIITSLCLYAFGSEEVKGFGATLLIGICASLFTSLYVTKTIFAILLDKFNVKNLGSFPLSFPKWDKALKPDWDWMGKAWMFYTFSIISISIGLVLFFVKVHEGQMMGIEFASGTSVQFGLKQPMEQEPVRALVEAESVKNPAALPSPSVVAVGTDQTHYEVVTPNINRAPVEQAVRDALGDKLDIQISSIFDQVDDSYGTARGKSVLPIANASFAVDGFVPPAASDHVGGVAIVLRNINPPLSPKQIQNRMDNVRQNVSSNVSGSVAYSVSAPTGDDQPSSFVVITAWNPTVSFAVDEGKWADGLAQPMWRLAIDAIHSPPSFEQETNFDPQVAGKMQQNAFLALFCSVAAIMVYIWVRFGNMKYGTATVIALLHDTVFTLAAMGFAHYFYALWPHNPLEVGPFRIDLTVVAGVLTIMSYSMIDTIVVFDRIRENRGRYGHLDRKVINDAINQTLSRTLLTAGTSIVTVGFMYFLGGEGIHAFTFVLLVGILVGTYSSVAIAAPLLLWGGDTAAPKGVARTELQKVAG